ncbi:MAG: hypothetical protein K5978_08695, partial [Campylobacter sp.]|nr:hypothetical protein [Campylobacter sp.]
MKFSYVALCALFGTTIFSTAEASNDFTITKLRPDEKIITAPDGMEMRAIWPNVYAPAKINTRSDYLLADNNILVESDAITNTQLTIYGAFTEEPDYEKHDRNVNNNTVIVNANNHISRVFGGSTDSTGEANFNVVKIAGGHLE